MAENDELLNYLKNLKIDDEESQKIVEYTKLTNGIIIDDTTGQKQLKFPVGKINTRKFVGVNLLNGYEKFKPQDLNSIYLLNDVFEVMKYSMEQDLIKLKNFNIISARRVLLLLMLIPVHKYKDLRFNIIYWNQFIIIDFDWKFQHQQKLDTNFLKLQYCGFKFEQIITEGDYNTSFYYFVNQKSSNTNIFFTAEIDAISHDKPIELKTIAKQPSFKHRQSKLIGAWCQNKLVGCKHTILGYRSSGFKLSKIQHFSNQQLEQEISLFSKQACLDSYQTILQQIIIKFQKNDSPVTFQLNYHYTSENLDDNIKFIEVKNELFDDIVPKSFQEYIEKIKVS